jgi:transcriptional regulator
MFADTSTSENILKSSLYNPTPFLEQRPSVLHEFIRMHPLATVISQAGETLNVSHMPILIESDSPQLKLVGHIVRKDPQYQNLRHCYQVLMIFQGPAAYVSPSLYEDPISIPTINYIAVHATGTSRPIDDPERTLAHLKALVQHYERVGMNRWSMSDLPQEFVMDMLDKIMAFEVAVTSIQGKFKLSQNRNEVDRRCVMEAFAQEPSSPSAELAGWMRRLYRQDP